MENWNRELQLIIFYAMAMTPDKYVTPLQLQKASNEPYIVLYQVLYLLAKLHRGLKTYDQGEPVIN